MTTFPITTLPTDGPELRLYDIDLSDSVNGLLKITDLGILHPLAKKLYLKKNDCGSGEVSLSLTDPKVGIIKARQFIAFFYRGAYRGGFFAETRELVDTTQTEKLGLVIKVSGRGPMVLLNDAMIYDWWTPGIENTRKFGTKNVMPDGGHSVPKGEMIYKLLDEAENYKTNPAGQHLQRYCWRAGLLGDAGDPATPPIGEPLLTWDFTDVVDSYGVAWPDVEDMEYQVGTYLDDVMRQIAAIRDPATPTWWYDFTITREVPSPTTGLFVLHAYSGSALDNDISDIMHFRVGHNCTEVSRKSVASDVRNHILVNLSDPDNPFAHVEDTAFMLQYRRRESFLRASNASLLVTGQHYGYAELADTKNLTRDIAVKVSDAKGPHIFTDYNLYDIISYDNAGGTETKHKIIGEQLEWMGDQEYADVTVEFET